MGTDSGAPQPFAGPAVRRRQLFPKRQRSGDAPGLVVHLKCSAVDDGWEHKLSFLGGFQLTGSAKENRTRQVGGVGVSCLCERVARERKVEVANKDGNKTDQKRGGQSAAAHVVLVCVGAVGYLVLTMGQESRHIKYA